MMVKGYPVLLVLLWLLPTGLIAQDGSRQQPLRVMLVPSDGGTEDGTRADWEPLFNAITASTGLCFEIRVGQSYSAVIEGLANNQVDVAYFGAVSFLTAQDRAGAELLAVAETGGSHYYYSGLFALESSGVAHLEDIRGRSLALSDPRSSSGFVYPLAVLMEAGIDPVRDVGSLVLSGSHTNSLVALAEGRVDVAAAPFESYIKAVRAGVIDPRKVHIIARSEAIPNPPLAARGTLDAAIKEQLRHALHTVHQLPGVRPEMIRGHGGEQVDRYNSEVPVRLFDRSREIMALVSDDLRAELLRKAAER